MKVLCISFWFYDHTIRLANSISKRESVMLMLPKNISSQQMGNIDKNIRLYLFDQHRRAYHPSSILTVKEIVKEVRRYDPDVIHIQFSNLISVLILTLLKKYPSVGTFHNIVDSNEEESRLLVSAFNYSKNKFDKIIVHSHILENIMERQYLVPKGKIHCLPIGKGDIELYGAYKAVDIKESCYQILYYGRICKYKGLDYLIKAEPIITGAFPNARIVIAGKGTYFEKCERLIVNRGNFIIYNEYISYEAAADLFQRCSVVVFPYIGASQADVIPIAYRFKKPVVASSVGGIPEIVDDGVTGVIVPPKDHIALAKAIIKLLNDESLRKQMGENGYRKLDTLMVQEEIADRTISVYQAATASHDNPGPIQLAKHGY